MVEKLPVKHMINLAAARYIAVAAEAEASANEWAVVIAIIDDGGHLVLLQRMDGTQLASIDLATQKALSALIYRRPTKAFEDSLLGGRQAVLALPGALPVNGGLPLTYGGDLIGAIGISGVTAEQDAQIAAAGVAALKSLRE